MTEYELKKVPFRMNTHYAMASEHVCIYSSEDRRLGFAVHTPVIADYDGFQVYGRTRRHWRIDDKIYKSRKKFLEALKDFNPEQND